MDYKVKVGIRKRGFWNWLFASDWECWINSSLETPELIFRLTQKAEELHEEPTNNKDNEKGTK